jgi:hypothetical protein
LWREENRVMVSRRKRRVRRKRSEEESTICKGEDRREIGIVNGTEE